MLFSKLVLSLQTVSTKQKNAETNRRIEKTKVNGYENENSNCGDCHANAGFLLEVLFCRQGSEEMEL